jgi:transcriptional regulator of NAD metabolism
MRTSKIISQWNKSVEPLYKLSGGKISYQVVREEVLRVKSEQRTSSYDNISISEIISYSTEETLKEIIKQIEENI